jgi:hypothetical protein
MLILLDFWHLLAVFTCLILHISNWSCGSIFAVLCRYNIATGLTERAKEEGELAQAGILVWLRFMATRQLTWNKNYNVKPRLENEVTCL